jgi:hypothetical protein
MSDALPQVTIALAGERPGPPPLVRLLVRVTMTNPSGKTRWFLIPTSVPRDGSAGGVSKLEQLSAGPVRIGRFLGRGGFYGVALEPGATLTLNNLEIGWWNAAAAGTPPPVEVRTANDVTLGGASIATWFDADPSVTGSIEIDVDAAAHTQSRRVMEDREVEVLLIGGRSVSVSLAGGT